MPKLNTKMGTREIEDDQGTPISISHQKSFNDEDEDYSPSVSHSKGKKKRKKNRADQSNEDKSPKKSDLNPVPAQEQGEVKSDKKKKKQKEKDKVEEEANDACYLPGQKHDRPHERDPLRIFFEVLYQQLSDCELAATWMMEWGLLRPEEAMKVYERQLKNRQQEVRSPADAVSLKTTSKILSRKEEKVSSNAGAKSMKRKVSNNSSEYDLIVSKIKKKKKQKQKISSS